jgi:hypothetical protein
MQPLAHVLSSARAHAGRLRSENGQGVVEYFLMAAAVVVALHVIDALGQEIIGSFGGIASML